jgi:hypothetical protein
MDKIDVKQAVALHPQVAFRVIDGEGVVILARDGQVQVVNPVGARILELAQEPLSVEAIVSTLVSEFEVSGDEARVDTGEFIEQMVEDRVLVWAGEEAAT